MEDRINSANAKMQAIEHAYMHDKNAQLIDLQLQGQRILEEHNLAAYAYHHSSKTIVHPSNRGKRMLDVPEVPQKVAGISDVSFSLAEVAMAASVKLPPAGHPVRTEWERKNIALVNAAGGTLGPCVPGDADVAVLGCNHNTAGLKAIWSKAKCSIERISEHGRYSAAKITGRCPSYAEPLEKGLRYFTIEWPAAEKWPRFIELWIEAANVGAALSKADTIFQLMGKAHGHIIQSPQDSNEDVAAMMARAKPPLEHMLVEIVKYTRDWSGGTKFPQYLDKLDQFTRASMDPTRFDAIDLKMLKTINEVTIGEGTGGRLRAGLLLMLVAGHKLTPSQIVVIGNKRTVQLLARTADTELIEFDAHVAKATKHLVDVAEVVQLVGKADIDMIGYVLGWHKKCTSTKSLLRVHFDRIAKAAGSKMKNPYVGDDDDSTDVLKRKAPPQTGMQELTTSGRLSNAVLLERAKAKGMDIGATVTRDDNMYIVTAFEDETVTMAVKSDKRRKMIVSYQKFLDEYAMKKEDGLVCRDRSDDCRLLMRLIAFVQSRISFRIASINGHIPR